MVGAPSEILEIAEKKSEEIAVETKRRKLLRDACEFAGMFKIDR